MSKTPRTDEMLKRYDTLEDGAAGFMLLRQSIEELEIELAEARAEIERKDKLLSIVGEVANNALYFNDNSDYEKALWEILAAAKPELFAECEMPRLKFISTSNETAKKGN